MAKYSPKSVESPVRCGLFVAAQSLIGFGVGVLVAEKLGRTSRQNVAITALSAGALATLPLVVDIFTRKINDPDSDRGQRRTLRSIREGDGGFDDMDE